MTFFPAPQGQPDKQVTHKIHGAKQDKLNTEEEGSQDNNKCKNPQRASVLAQTGTYSPESPSG